MEFIFPFSVNIICSEVVIFIDSIVEDNEFFEVSLLTTDSIVLVGGNARVNIIDDDGERY